MSLQFDCRHRYPSGFQLDAEFCLDGGIVALLGPSGSGKTTIVSLIAGLLRPDDGVIRLGGRILTDAGHRFYLPPEKRRVGLLFQDHCLFPHLSVRRNLHYGRRRQLDQSLDFQRVVAMLGLDNLLDRKPRTLSGGQQQRVALGRAILAGPQILLLDEPLSAVETVMRHEIADFIKRTAADWAIPTLLVSHNHELVERLADRIITIADGRVVGERRV